MQTHFLAHNVGKEEGHEAVKRCGKHCAAASRPGKQVGNELADRDKPARKGNACPRADKENQQGFSCFDADFSEIPRRFFQLQAFVAVAFNQVVDPQHDFGVNRLRAGITAPQTSGNRRPPKQPEGANHQQQRKVNQVTHAQRQPENEEMPVRNVENDRLTAAPVEPWNHIKHKLGRQYGGNTQFGEPPFRFFRMDALAFRMDLNHAGSGINRLGRRHFRRFCRFFRRLFGRSRSFFCGSVFSLVFC